VLGVEDAPLLVASIFIAEHVGKCSLFKAMILWEAKKMIMWCELDGLATDSPIVEFLFNLRWACRQRNFNVLWHNNILMSRLKFHPPGMILGVGGLVILQEV
jgi:hypothetical protein